MNTVLSSTDKPRLLRAGVQPAIAAGDDEFAAAAALELISILRGPAFRGSPRSMAFLRFVVEEALAGRRDLLKERTVGAAVLGKAPGYDTGADCGVRVRANEVRKRLAAHYDSEAPRAGIRIELPRGSYAPNFVMLAAQPAPGPAAPPMRLWQLAAPSLFAAFLALIAIRGGVEQSDAFSRFWNHALAGRTAIAIAVDAEGPSSISPAMADAAVPLESLASAFQLPLHVVAAGPQAADSRAFVIRMSTRQKPSEPPLVYLDGAEVSGGRDGAALWLWADTPDKTACGATVIPGWKGAGRPVTVSARAEAEQGTYASHVFSPFFFHETKTFAFEVWESSRDSALPDRLILPVGHGAVLFLGAYLGFRDLLAAGEIRALRLIGVQAAACAPLAAAWQGGPTAVPEERPGWGFASPPPIAPPPSCRPAERATARSSPSPSPRSSRRSTRLARAGFYVEPTAAAGPGRRAKAFSDHMPACPPVKPRSFR